MVFFINVPVGALVLAVTPRLVRESVADVAHRHFDVPGAVSITGGLMLLVYAMTRAAQHAMGHDRDDRTVATSAALVVAFVAIELRVRRRRCFPCGCSAHARSPAPTSPGC